MWRRPAPAVLARALVFLSTLAPAVSSAHDLWIVSGQYRLDPFETTRVFVNNGDAFPESLSLLGKHRVSSLAVHGPTDKVPITEFRVEGKSLSFTLSPRAEGSHVLALATRARRVRLKADDFNDYLDENGLTGILVKREEAGELDKPAVERYTKWAKAVIDVGESDVEQSEPAWSRPVGHLIELIPEENPNRIGAGDSLGVQLLYDGEPLSGATLTGGKAGGVMAEILALTDDEGRARVTVPSDGRWYLRAIHMIRKDDRPDVPWESFWCTLTFEVP